MLSAEVQPRPHASRPHALPYTRRVTAPAPTAGHDGYLTLHGLRHHYVRWGDPGDDPVVFLHGLLNQGRYWEHLAPGFVPGHAAYAPDLRGHGESEHAPGGYLVWAFAMDLRGFVEELDLEGFDLVAHSLGSRVAMAYARDHSHRLNHLVLTDMGPQLSATPGDAAARRAFATEQEALAHFAQVYPGQGHDFLRRQLAASLVLDEATGNLVFRFDPALQDALGRGAAVEIPYLWESLEHIKCPTLVIRGEGSTALSREVGEEMTRRLPHGRLVEIAAAGDDTPLEQPAAFAAAVRAFLRE